MRKGARKTLHHNLVLRKESPFWQFRRVVDGRPVYKSTKCRDRVEAEGVALAWLGKIESDGADVLRGKKAKAAPSPTYGECGRRLLKTVKDDPKKVSYKGQLMPSIAAWDTTLVTDVTPSMCLELMAGLRSRFKPNSIRQIADLSSMTFVRAIGDRVATRNPWKEKSVAKAIPRVVARARVLSKEEQGPFFEGLSAASGLVGQLAVVLLGAGLRIGEATKLVPREHLDVINPSGPLLRLTADITKGGKPRVVPIAPFVLDAIYEAIGGRGLGSKERIFPVQEKYVQRMFQRVRLKLDMDHITPHDLRRTFATRCALAGCPPKALMRWMGHSKIDITAKFYTHVDEADDTRIATEVYNKLWHEANQGKKVVSIAGVPSDLGSNNKT